MGHFLEFTFDSHYLVELYPVFVRLFFFLLMDYTLQFY